MYPRKELVNLVDSIFSCAYNSVNHRVSYFPRPNDKDVEAFTNHIMERRYRRAVNTTGRILVPCSERAGYQIGSARVETTSTRYTLLTGYVTDILGKSFVADGIVVHSAAAPDLTNFILARENMGSNDVPVPIVTTGSQANIELLEHFMRTSGVLRVER